MVQLSRYPEIDMVRGVAILMMILFHTLFDLNYFQIVSLEIYSGFWHYFAFATASLFLLVVGISLTISRARAQQEDSRASCSRKTGPMAPMPPSTIVLPSRPSATNRPQPSKSGSWNSGGERMIACRV